MELFQWFNTHTGIVPMLTHEEIMFYSRQLGISGWGKAAQERLKNSKIFVAGAGGLGSPVLYYLAAAGIGTIVICDYDTIEITNLNRQILHSHGKIGQSKVDSAFSSLSDLNPFINIVRIKTKLTKTNSSSLIGNADLIIDCLDNFATRHLLNRVSVGKKIPMIHGGVAEFRGQITFLHPPETPCLACFLDQKDSKSKVQVAGATAGVIGSLQACEAVKYCAGIGPSLKNRLMFWDGLSMKFETLTIRRNPRCRVCKNK